MSLPRFVVIKANSNEKYLSYIHEDVQVHGFLQFSGEEVLSPYVKYEVELAKSDKGLLHIRSCYNNKYWVRRSQNDNWIVAAADEPEEDQSRWSCTLFEPLYVDVDHHDSKSTTLRFRHVQLGNYVCSLSMSTEAAAPTCSCLFAATDTPDDKDLSDVYTISDWKSFVILPQHIALKGDNGKYLSAILIGGYPFLQFASNDIGDERVGNEVFLSYNQNIRIKSNFFGKFWRRSPNWIWADSTDTTNNNNDTMFTPIKVEDENVIALRNLGNNNFCSRFTADGNTDCLNAAVSTISKEARLMVEELVLSRKIDNVNFRLLDSRIYNQNVVTMTTEESINRTSSPNTVALKFSYTETTTSTWNASVTVKLGVKTTIQSGIPRIVEGKIEISAEVTVAYQWGETKTSSIVTEVTHTVTVPPMTRVKVSLLATKASCDVPFSYTQRDTLTNGREVIRHNMTDGLFTGTNSFNVKVETQETRL